MRFTLVLPILFRRASLIITLLAGIGLITGVIASGSPLPVIGLAVLGLSMFIAYRHPVIATSAIVLLSSGVENTPGVVPVLIRQIEIWSMNVRPWDPLVFGMVVTVLWKLATFDQTKKGLIRAYPIMFLFFALLTVKCLLSIGTYGINTVGEARTYYSYLVMIPYLWIHLKCSKHRLLMLKVLASLSFLFVILGFLGAVYGGEIYLSVRILTAGGALAVLYGLVALILFLNQRITVPPVLLVFASTAGGFLVLFTAHRSVWLAATSAAVTLLFLGQLRIRRFLQFAVVAVAIGVFCYFGLVSVGHNPAEFLGARLQAFLDPDEDPTAYWRKHLWQESIEEIKRNPLLGSDLGRHFQLYDPYTGALVTTSPHSLYVSIGFQLGLAGLLLYLGFIAALCTRLLKFRRLSQEIGDRTATTMGIVVLVAAHAYYIAYPMELDWITWAYLGVAASVRPIRGHLGGNSYE